MHIAVGSAEVEARVKEFAPLVRRIAHHLAARLPSSVQVDDIIQAGLIGLMEAATRYEPGMGTQFETYAAQRIRGAMLDELRQSDWLPRSVRESLRRIETAMSRLEQRLGRHPTEAELARDMKLPIGEYQELLQEAKGSQLVNLGDFDGADGDDYLERNIPDNRANPLDLFADVRFHKALATAIEGLPERERLLMGLYYEQDRNFREIAAIMEVSESRICQLHSQAVVRLRAKLKDW